MLDMGHKVFVLTCWVSFLPNMVFCFKAKVKYIVQEEQLHSLFFFFFPLYCHKPQTNWHLHSLRCRFWRGVRVRVCACVCGLGSSSSSLLSPLLVLMCWCVSECSTSLYFDGGAHTCWRSVLSNIFNLQHLSATYHHNFTGRRKVVLSFLHTASAFLFCCFCWIDNDIV